MDDQHVNVELISQEGSTIAGVILIEDEDPDQPELVGISLSYGDRNTRASAQDFWAALCIIRLDLERHGLFPKCFGASRNVYPSGMCRSMGLGDKAYRLTLGCFPKMADLVSIFDSGPDVEPVTVDVQRTYHDQWLKSRK